MPSEIDAEKLTTYAPVIRIPSIIDINIISTETDPINQTPNNELLMQPNFDNARRDYF
jgi:hypothetical protein